MKKLTSGCKARLAEIYAARSRTRRGRYVPDDERESWTDFEPFDGEDYMEVDPQGRLWCLNPDSPAYAVDVTDVTLEYCGGAARLVALTGPAGCGKTTAALELESRSYVRVRFAGPLKDMLRALGLTEAQVDGDQKEQPSDLLCGHPPRHAMQTLGTQWGRAWIGADVWCNAAMVLVDQLLAANRNVVIDDCHFDNEALAIHDRGGQIFSLSRKGAGLRTTHASEVPITSHFVSRFVSNNGAVQDTVDHILAHLPEESPDHA